MYWKKILIPGVALTGAASILVWNDLCVRHSRGIPNERNSSASLKTLGTAQMDFRSNDRDGNGKPEFWRADVAGLYAMVPPGSDYMIKLIELPIARADSRKVLTAPEIAVATPKSGYWFQSIRFSDETALPRTSPDRWGVCAYADEYGVSGRWTYILSHQNVIYKKDLGRPGGIDVYPNDPVAEGWSTMD